MLTISGMLNGWWIMPDITKIYEERKNLDNQTSQIDIHYKAERVTDGVIKQLLMEAESEFLPHAHILCRKKEVVPKKIYCKFRNITECMERLNTEIVEICSEFTLKRLDQAISLTFDINTRDLYLSGIVPNRRKELSFSEYEYYQYHKRVVRDHNNTYEVIDGATGEWRDEVYYYEQDFIFDRVPLSVNAAKEMIRKEKEAGEKWLLHNLDIAFEKYGKSEEDLIPDFRKRIMGTEYAHAITQGELTKNEYYVSSMDGAILKAVHSWDESLILKRYNVDANGIFFWDSRIAILKNDLKDGRTQLWRLPEECVKELDNEIRNDSYNMDRIPAQWFRHLKNRALDDERKWLTDIAEGAIQEYRHYLEVYGGSDETLRKFDRKTFQNKVHEAEKSLSNFVEKDYVLFEFGKSSADYANCIILYALKGMYEFGLNGSYDWFLIRLSESTISGDEMLSLGSKLRGKLTEMKAFYSETDITVHLLEWHSNKKENFKWHTYYKDMENGATWDWIYETTPGYSQEDGWWHNKPVITENSVANMFC